MHYNSRGISIRFHCHYARSTTNQKCQNSSVFFLEFLQGCPKAQKAINSTRKWLVKMPCASDQHTISAPLFIVYPAEYQPPIGTTPHLSCRYLASSVTTSVSLCVSPHVRGAPLHLFFLTACLWVQRSKERDQ